MRCLQFFDEGRYSWTSSSRGTGKAAMLSSWARLSWPMPCRSPTTPRRPSLMRVSWDSRFLNMRATAIFSASRSWRMAAKPSTTDFTRWVNCGLQDVGAVHALGDGHDLVEREGVAQQSLEGELERFALELLRALLELALEVGGFALRGFDLGLELRLDAPALLVEAPLVVDVAVLVRLLQPAQVAPELQLLAEEPGERAFLGAQRLVQGLALRVELRFRLGGELGLELLAVRRDAALEVPGVALDGLARDALGKREAVIALGAGDLLPAVDDDGARHGSSEKSGSEPETRKKRKSGSDPMVREVVAHSVSQRATTHALGGSGSRRNASWHIGGRMIHNDQELAVTRDR